MINIFTIIKNVDNSGAKISKCISLPRNFRVRGAQAGNVIKVLIKTRVLKRHIKKKSKMISKGQVCRAVVVNQNGLLPRWGNIFIGGSTNSVVLINEYDIPYATRIFGVVFKEVRKKTKYKKILTLAPRVV